METLVCGPRKICASFLQTLLTTLLTLSKSISRKVDFTVESNSVAYPGILFGGVGSTNSVEERGQRERGSGGGSPLVRGSGGSCNLVQEISFHMVKFS